MTARANTSAAALSYQPSSTLIACLVLVASLLNLQQGRHFCIVIILCPANGIRHIDIPWCPQIHIPFRGDPPLDDIKVAIDSSPPEWSASTVGGLVHFDPVILQHLMTTGGLQAVKKGVRPYLSFTLTFMSGCARSKGITADLCSPSQA